MFQQRWQKAVFLNFLWQPHLHIIYISKTFLNFFRYNNINESLISVWNIHMYRKQQSKKKKMLRIQVKKMKYQMKRRLLSVIYSSWYCSMDTGECRFLFSIELSFSSWSDQSGCSLCLTFFSFSFSLLVLYFIFYVSIRISKLFFFSFLKKNWATMSFLGRDILALLTSYFNLNYFSLS